MNPAQIKSIHFKNFKVLRKATLPLSRFTLIVGPNGSGKSTAVEAISAAANPKNKSYDKILTAALRDTLDLPSHPAAGQGATVEVSIDWMVGAAPFTSETKWLLKGDQVSSSGPYFVDSSGQEIVTPAAQVARKTLNSFRTFSFNSKELARPVQISPQMELHSSGANLAGVLDDLQNKDNGRFEALNEDLQKWLPDFDRVLFDVPNNGQKEILMRTRSGERIQAEDLSDGTLFALAFLTLAYMPKPPSIVCFEEPEHGIHPRLLQEIKEGMYRLAYPEGYGDKRAPVQVIATTHSPYLLDLYKDHPEQIVIASKDEHGTKFERLSEMPHLDEFLQDAPLGDVWYSGVLGGVPIAP